MLGVFAPVPLRGGPPDFAQLVDANNNLRFQNVPLGGQGLVLANLEYRFPTWWQMVWGEVFVDSGQVYQSLRNTGQPGGFPPLRTALGLGVIFKIGLPIKFEYAADVKRILGRPRTPLERETQLKSLLFSAGFQF
jgi:outer membrane protein assembly factor BamA